MTIEIYDIETFETPEGPFEIIPLPVEDVDIILDFIELDNKRKLLTVKESKKRTKKDEANPKNTEEVKFVLKEITPIADQIVDKGTQKQDTEETLPLPMKYRNIQNRIQLCLKIIEVTMGKKNTTNGDDNPLSKPANK